MPGDIVSPATVLYNNLGQSIPLSLDAFQRLRVSEPATIFDSKQVYDAQPLFWSTAVTGGGGITYVNQRSSSSLTVAGGVDTAVRQTKRYFSYQPGKSFLVLATFMFTGGEIANITREIGYFDSSDGIFLRLSGSDLSVVIRSSVTGAPVENVIPRTSWTDKLDGSGPSKLVLSLNAVQIFWIDFEWLGVGSVRIGLVINGQFIPVYQYNHANIITSIYMQTPNLPVRYETRSTGGAGSLEAICCSVTSEGGQDTVGSQRSATRNTGRLLAAAAFESLIAIRNKTGVYLHAPVIPLGVNMACSSTGQGLWRLLLNPTVAGAFTAVAVSNSAVEYDVTRTTITPGTGIEIASGTFTSDSSQATAQIKEALSLGVTLAGVRDELVLGMQNINPGNETYYAGIQWIEPN